MKKSDYFTSPLKGEIDSTLQDLLKDAVNRAKAISPIYGDLLTQTQKLIKRGGKRLRPLLTVLAYQGYGGQDMKAILPVAATQELFHAFILMQDDIIDRDQYRWGGPNLSGHYRKYLANRLKKTEAEHYADAWAMLAGDICLGISIDVMSRAKFPADLKIKAIQLHQETLFALAGGELIDVAMTVKSSSSKMSLPELKNLYHYKTAAYTFCGPIKLGALLAEASPKELTKLDQLGSELGIIFQIQDDILGIFANQAQLGKPIASDLRDGKQTILMYYAQKLATPSQNRYLKGLLGESVIGQTKLAKARNILTDCGAVSASQELAQEYATRARDSLTDLKVSADAREHLFQLIDFSLIRKF